MTCSRSRPSAACPNRCARAGAPVAGTIARLHREGVRMDHAPSTPALNKSLGTLQLWGIAVGLVISGEYFGWSYGWGSAGTLGFLVTSTLVALMYTSFIFSFTELTTAMPQAGGPFEYSRRAFGPLGGY